MLDPFGGTGTVGRVATAMGRRFILIEKQPDYYEIMRRELRQMPLHKSASVDFDDLQYWWSANHDA